MRSEVQGRRAIRVENGAGRRIEDGGRTAFGDELRERCGSGGFGRELAIKELEHVVEAFGCGGGRDDAV